MIGFFYKEYGVDGCDTPKAFLSLTIIFSVIQLVASYFIQYANGFVSGVVMAYVTYLNFQAVATYTDTECESSSWSDDAPMYSGFCILVATLSYVGYETRLLSEAERHEIDL